MKKILFIGLLITILFIGVNNVYASEGPSSDNAHVLLYDGTEDYDIYTNGTVDNNALSNVTYDKDTNTLTITNFKGDYDLYIYNMGDDFKLNVVGDNEINSIYLVRNGWDTTLNIIGDGSLTINKNKNEQTAVELLESKMVVDKNVTLKMYAQETDDDDPDYKPAVIIDRLVKTDKANEAIIFKDNSKDLVTVERDWYSTGAENILGVGFINSEHPREYTIVEKNSKQYGMYFDGENYIVTGNEIRHDDINNEYFFDTTIEANNNTYSSIENAESKGYTVTSNQVNITKDAIICGYLLQLDNNNKEYALYIGTNNSGDYLFDITSTTITLANNKTYTILTNNTDTNIDDLTPKYGIEYADTYTHFVYSSYLEILPNTYKFISGSNQTYTNGQDNLTFRIQADYSLFKNGGKVYIDGNEINDYSSSEGSTIITLSKEYLSTLSAGDHTMKVVFNNGESSETNFTITKENVVTETNPNTFDNVITWVSLLIISAIGIIINKYKLRVSNN